MAPKPIVICFDMSGTIVEWNKAFEAGLREALGDWVGRWGDEQRASALLDEALRQYRKSRRLGKRKLASVRDAVAVLPTDGEERTILRIAHTARKLQPLHAKFADGAEETLQALHDRKIRMAVITNLDESSAKQLWSRLRLSRFIREKDLFTASGEVRKPHKRMYRRAAVKLGVPAQQCVMVGDSYKQDIQGAIRAGWRAIWIHQNTRRLARRRVPGGHRITMIASIHAVPRSLQSWKVPGER